ncbi:MAG: AzlD domain-containing protein [Actinobacteria bacterium]|nr:AzlD domain-containing protein [Actinomycetota bacterium]
MSDFLAVLVVGVSSYVSRSIFIVTLARRAIPESARRVLDYVAPSVLGALVVAVLIGPTGEVTLGAPELAALAAGGVVAYLTRNHLITLVTGMTVFWVIRALV